MTTTWRSTRDQRNIFADRRPQDCQCRANLHAANMGNVGFDVADYIPGMDNQTLLYIGGGILALFVGYQLLSGGSKGTRSRTASAKAKYISDYAAQTGRLPKV